MPSSASAAARLRELRADETATRVLARAEMTVDRSQAALLYGQRLALLGQVSAALHAIVVAEEKARREVRDMWEYSVWMGAVMDKEGRIVEAAERERDGKARGEDEKKVALVRPLLDSESGAAVSASGEMPMGTATGDPDVEAAAAPSSSSTPLLTSSAVDASAVDVDDNGVSAKKTVAPAPPEEFTVTTTTTTTTTTNELGEEVVTVATTEVTTDADGNVVHRKEVQTTPSNANDGATPTVATADEAISSQAEGGDVSSTDPTNTNAAEATDPSPEPSAAAGESGSTAAEDSKPAPLRPTSTSTCTTTRKVSAYRLSAGALAIIADPTGASEKMQQAAKDRALERLLLRTRPAPSLAPRLHFVPPMRLRSSGLQSGFTAPILSALYGPTSAADSLLEGRPAHTIPASPSAMRKKGSRVRQRGDGGGGAGKAATKLSTNDYVNKLRATVPNSGGGAGEATPSVIFFALLSNATSGEGGDFVPPASFASAPSFASASVNNNRRTPPSAGIVSTSSTHKLKGAANTYGGTGNAARGGLSAVLAKTYAPREENRLGGPRSGRATPSPSVGPSRRGSGSGSVFASSPFLKRRIDSADPSTRAALLLATAANVASQQSPTTLPTSPQHPAISVSSHLSGGGGAGVGGSASGAASEGTGASPRSSQSHSPRSGSQSPSPAATPAPAPMGFTFPSAADTPWGWAEQDSARAVAVMVCLVADGLDEANARETLRAEAESSPPNEQSYEEEWTLDPSAAAAIEAAVAAAKEKRRVLRTTEDGANVADSADAERHAAEQRAREAKAAEEEAAAREEEENRRMERLRRAARAFRAAVNKIAVDEHEDRYEIVHEASAQHKALMAAHRTEHAAVRRTTLTGQQHSRMALERRCTLELLKIVILWQDQHDKMMAVYWGRRAVLQRVSQGRRALEASETAARATISDYAAVLSRRLLRAAAEEAEVLRPAQIAFSAERAAERQRAVEARQYKAAMAEREQLIKDHHEVERLLRQKEAARKAQREEQWALEEAAASECPYAL